MKSIATVYTRLLAFFSSTKLLIILGILGSSTVAFGQSDKVKPIPRDTSFNVKSTYIKEKKRFSLIEIVEPVLPENVVEQKNMVYATLRDTPYGDRELHADIFYPRNQPDAPLPGVVLIHGGGWKSGSKSHLVPLAQQLAARGYVTAAVEYRLSLEAPYPAAVYDIKTAIKWLRANADKFNLDKNKVAVLGTSAGAQLASLVGTTNGMKKFENNLGDLNESSDVQAVVNIDGIVSFVHPEASAEGKAASEWLGGSRTERPDHWKEASPLEYVNESTPPFLFINSSIPRFHAGRDDFAKNLDEYGTYYEIHTIPDTPHPFWLFHPWFAPAFEYTIGFLNKVFKQS